MSGVPNLGSPTPVPVPATPVAPAAPAVPAPATPAVATDQLALSQAAATAAPAADPGQIAMLRNQLRAGSPVEATMALYQLETLAASNRAQVLPILLDQLAGGADDPATRGAIDILTRMKAPEAAPYLQQIASSGASGLRGAASAGYTAIAGPPPSAAPAATPSAVPTPGAPAIGPNTPLTGPAPGQAPAAPPANTGDLLARLLNKQSAPAAAVEISKLPTAQMVAVVGRALSDFELEPQTVDLLTTILARRMKEPGVLPLLKTIVKKDPYTYSSAVGKAALALYSTQDPANLTDILRVMANRNATMNPIKRVLADAFAKNPQALAHPGTPVVLAAILKANENTELAMAASHTLGLIKTAQARDALANSPLLHSSYPQLALRAMWDLGQHPAPYPAAAIAQLQSLAQTKDPQVAAKAKELLARKQ